MTALEKENLIDHVKIRYSYELGIKLEKSLTDYEQLQRDVKRFMELRKELVVGKTYTNATDFENNMKEKNELEEKLSKVGKGE